MKIHDFPIAVGVFGTITEIIRKWPGKISKEIGIERFQQTALLKKPERFCAMKREQYPWLFVGTHFRSLNYGVFCQRKR